MITVLVTILRHSGENRGTFKTSDMKFIDWERADAWAELVNRTEGLEYHVTNLFLKHDTFAAFDIHDIWDKHGMDDQTMPMYRFYALDRAVHKWHQARFQTKYDADHVTAEGLAAATHQVRDMITSAIASCQSKADAQALLKVIPAAFEAEIDPLRPLLV